MPRSSTELLVGSVLVAVTLAVYWPVADNQFVDYDDPLYVTANTQVQAGLTAPGVGWAFTTTTANHWHPLTWLSLQLDAQLFGPNPRGYHLHNLLLHCVNTLLLFVVLRAMTGAVWRSAAVAALFAWHPLHVESVAWVTERKDVLSAFFWMLTLGAYLLYVRKPGVMRYLLVCVSLGLGLLAKPVLVTLPFVLLLLDYWPLGRFMPGGKPRPALSSTAEESSYTPQANPRTVKQLLWEKVPLLSLAAASSAQTWYAQHLGGALPSLTEIPLGSRLAYALISYTTYLQQTVLPFDLAAYYPYPRGPLPVGQVAGSGVVLGAITALALALVRRRPYLSVGWLWYLGTLLPMIGFVQVGDLLIQGMADRYTYVPLIGVFIMLAWGFSDLLSPLDFAARVLVPITAVFLVFCLVLTRQQVGYWHDSLRLWEHTVAVTRDNAIAHNNLGKNYQLLGRPQQALAQYREALRINPQDVFARLNLGMLLVTLGESREAVEHLSASLRYDPHMIPAHEGMGYALMQLGEKEAAAAHFAESLRLSADAFAEAGRFEEAAAVMRQALDPASRAARPELVQEIEAKLRTYEEHQALPKSEPDASARGADGLPR